MGVFSRFESGVEDAFEKAAGSVFKSPIEPAQIAKRAEKQMQREKLVGAGRQHAPTLYTVLVGPADDRNLFGFYPTLAAEIETYLMAKGTDQGLKFDGRPLVRFIVDEHLKSGKFDVIAENVSAPIIEKLRREEMEFYGIATPAAAGVAAGIVAAAPAAPAAADPLAGLDSSELRNALYRVHGNPEEREFQNDRDNFDVSQSAIDAAESAAAHSIGSTDLLNLTTGRSYELSRTTMILGRGDTCDIVVSDANASRNHAQLSQDPTGRWKLTDLASTNGTFLNDRQIERALLRDGDHLTIGMTVFEFRER